jgi:16S rRNA A1518/A1519 N6-dimethyltransferase RsmA/KsgA/DIM1 with predicted DNA glycosylase/AP lyase activity
VLHLVPHRVPHVTPDRIPAFRRLVTSLFSYRRKQMRKALREATGLGPERAAALLVSVGIDPELRPEKIPMEGFVRLLDALQVADSSGQLYRSE